MKQTHSHHQNETVNQLNFREYIDWRVNKDLHLQKEFLCDDEGNLIVDYVGKIESLRHDFNYICNHIGIPQIKLPRKNKSLHGEYCQYYDSSTREIVDKAFSNDIKLFGYSF